MYNLPYLIMSNAEILRELMTLDGSMNTSDIESHFKQIAEFLV